MLDPRRLRLLIQLQSLGTVRAVAQAAALSPSAVSQQLAALERESGTALIERHGRSVALTDAGVALAGHARVILERIDVAEEALRALKDAPEGTVRVSAFTSAMRAFVIDAAAEVARQHPGIAVQLAELEPAENVPALERGDVDLAIVADFGDGSLPPTPHLRSVPLTRDELLVVLAPDAQFTGLADLHDANWLLDGTELEQHVIRRCRRAGFEPRFAGRLFSHEALLYAVQRGLGVTILPSFVAAPPGTVQLRPLDPPAYRELLVLHREEALTRRSVALALDVLIRSANELDRVTEPPREATPTPG
ncbi:LysR family transcriptional regulator [Solirubrobacter taibaiensis]|nr:LysR family transcriptional regulator [Solirubrobacter taibaiensis]